MNYFKHETIHRWRHIFVALLIAYAGAPALAENRRDDTVSFGYPRTTIPRFDASSVWRARMRPSSEARAR